MMLEGMQPRGPLPRLKANIEVGKPEYKVGDDIEVVSHWHFSKGEKLKVVKEEYGRIWIGPENGKGYAFVLQDDIIKLLPPESKPGPLMMAIPFDPKKLNAIIKPYGYHVQKNARKGLTSNIL